MIVKKEEKLISKIVVFSNVIYPETSERICLNKPSDIKTVDKAKGIFISKDYKQDIAELLTTIRKSHLWFLLVFSEKNINCNLLDGNKTFREAVESFAQFEALNSNVHLNLNNLLIEQKILFYFYSRGNYELFPQFDVNALKLYKYPLLDLLSENNGLDTLSRLVKKGFLRYEKLIDRVRFCNKCGSAHLHFVDICPNCQSIDIKKIKALHCFTCGYVGKEEDFETADGLICPKCYTRLRHIGVDYDIAENQYSCNSCGYLFIEPLVIAKCLSCLNIEEPDKLGIWEFYSVKLTQTGKDWLLLGETKMAISVFRDSFKYVTIEFVKLLINWILNLNKRGHDFKFALLSLRFENVQELIELYGFPKTTDMLSEFSLILRGILRDTDIISQYEDYWFIVLLPFTEKKGIEDRLEKAILQVSPQNGVSLKAKITTIYLPRNKTDDAESLIREIMS